MILLKEIGKAESTNLSYVDFSIIQASSTSTDDTTMDTHPSRLSCIQQSYPSQIIQMWLKVSIISLEEFYVWSSIFTRLMISLVFHN